TGRLARSIDRAFAGSSLAPRGPDDLSPEERVEALGLIERFYDRKEHFEPGSAFFTRPEPIEPEERRVRGLGRQGEVVDLRWPSGFEPLWSDAVIAELLGTTLRDSAFAGRIDKSGSVRDKYLGAKSNRTAAARWFRHHG